MMRRVGLVNRPSRRRPGRRGVVTLELIVTLPILFFTLLAIFEFGFLGLTLQTGHTAVIEGARFDDFSIYAAPAGRDVFRFREYAREAPCHKTPRRQGS